jgi:hypothetical protein
VSLVSTVPVLCNRPRSAVRKHINALFEQNNELLIIEAGGTYSYHWTFNSYRRVLGPCSSVFKKVKTEDNDASKLRK